MTSAGYMALVGGGAKLPYDAEVKYLGCYSGGRYLVLDYFEGSKLEIVSKFTISTGDVTEQDVLSNQDQSSGRFVLGVGSDGDNGAVFAYSRSASGNDGNASWVMAGAQGKIVVCDCVYDTSNDVKTLTVDGTSVTVNRCKSISNSNKKIHVFCGVGLFVFYKGRMYYCRLYKNDILWFDLIPVRFTNELGQSEGAMYDRVTGQLFRNQGTGAFEIGPDVSAVNRGGGGVSLGA